MVALIALGCASRSPPAAPPDDAAPLEAIRIETGVPGLAVAVVADGRISGFWAVGTRRAGEVDPIGPSDRWHLGSNTKAMTATLAAIEVRDGRLSWEATLPELFPELSEIHSAFRTVTLRDLVEHRGGMPGDRGGNAPFDVVVGPHALPEGRARLAARVLTAPPASAPGTFTYSNTGYVLVGAAIERATGRSWEAELEAKLFEPLGMETCTYGAPARHDPGPWGHRAVSTGWSPVDPRGDDADNPALIGPAGTVSCALDDWAKFVWASLVEDPALLPPDAWKVLHEPRPGTAYVGGWLVTERPWAEGPLWTHTGSNTMFMADVWASPTEKRAWLAVSNAGGDPGLRAVDAAVGWAIAERGTSK